MIVAAVDRQALSLGLYPGMKLADARARVPELVTLDQDARADRLLLEQLALSCERYTPIVALHPPRAIILDITGCIHLFGNERALAQDVEARFDGAGLSLQWAAAGTVDGALALARFGLKEGAEAQLPVAALEMDDRTHSALERAGLYRIGDLADRPRAPLAARFGAEMVLKLERLLGEEDRPVNPKRRIAPILTERRFAEPIGHLEAVTQCLLDLFAEAAGMLEKREQGARHIILQLFRCDGHVARLDIETGAATRDSKLFGRLLAERIDSLNDPLDPGFGYDLLRLAIRSAERLSPAQSDIEGKQDSAPIESELLGQLSIRLGRANVLKFAPADSHIPEHGLRAHPALDHQAGAEWEMLAPDEPPHRPLFLFDPPQRIEVIAEVPDGPPRRFTWRRSTHSIIRAEGPERIASLWWRRRYGYNPGKSGLTRDYYRVEDSDGRRYWLFRHGLYGSEKTRPEWYIHGRFA